MSKFLRLLLPVLAGTAVVLIAAVLLADFNTTRYEPSQLSISAGSEDATVTGADAKAGDARVAQAVTSPDPSSDAGGSMETPPVASGDGLQVVGGAAPDGEPMAEGASPDGSAQAVGPADAASALDMAQADDAADADADVPAETEAPEMAATDTQDATEPAAADAAPEDGAAPEMAIADPAPDAAEQVASSGGAFGLGRPALPDEVAAWDIDIRPDGAGLPDGSGDVATGEGLWIEQCAVCHGDFGEAVGRWPQIAGGEGTLTSDDPVKTPGSYWPYLSTVYDYVHRAMPFGNAQSLSDDDVYALTAYILYLNFLVDEDFTLTKDNFLDVEMPNAGNFFMDDRPETELATFSAPVCMEDCAETVEISARARVLDVTPDGAAGGASLEGGASQESADSAPEPSAEDSDTGPVDEARAGASGVAEAPDDTGSASTAATDATEVDGDRTETTETATDQTSDQTTDQTAADLTAADQAVADQAVAGAAAPASDQPAPDATEPVAQSAAPATATDASAAADPELVAAGEAVFRKCQACHQVGEGATNRVGPHLNEVTGRSVGGLDGFRYSKALTEAGEAGTVWDQATLSGFLADPRGYLKGTKMSFAGLKSQDDIDAVIAYIQAEGG